MANGIEFCQGCKYDKPFKKARSEPAFLSVQNTGLLRAVMRICGSTHNTVAVMDDDQVVRTTMVVPDAAIDDPGSIKLATQSCSGPVLGMCGAELLLEMRYTDNE